MITCIPGGDPKTNRIIHGCLIAVAVGLWLVFALCVMLAWGLS